MEITRVIEQTCVCCGEDYLVYKESDLHPNYDLTQVLLVGIVMNVGAK